MSLCLAHFSQYVTRTSEAQFYCQQTHSIPCKLHFLLSTLGMLPASHQLCIDAHLGCFLFSTVLLLHVKQASRMLHFLQGYLSEVTSNWWGKC